MRASKIVLLFIGLIALAVVSCKREENLKEQEERRIREQLKNIKVDFYRTIKVTVRSTTAMPDDPKFAEARKSMLGLVTGIFRYHVNEDGTITTDSSKIGVMDLINMGRTFYSAKDILLNTDEDSLPTILHNILYLLGGKTGMGSLGYFNAYDNNYEHAILGAVWFVTPSAPKEFVVYEFHKTDEDRIADKEILVAVKLAKAYMYLDNEYYFHSKEKSDQYLEFVENNKDYFLQHPFLNFFEEVKLATPEQQYYQLHSLGYVMRALAENKMDMEDEADEDLGLFVEEAEKGGGDNELVWMCGAYVNIKKENKDKALVYLDKLEKSDKIGAPEKKAVADIKSYVKDRDNKKALTRFKDKLAMITITYDLMKARLNESKKMQQFKESKEGEKFYGFQKDVSDQSELINSLGDATNVDSLSSKAKDLVNGLFDKVKDATKDDKE
jgi:hypothetical protein